MSIKRTREELIEELIEEQEKIAIAELKYNNALKVINKLIESLKEMPQQKYCKIPMVISIIERLKEKIAEENADEKENYSFDREAEQTTVQSGNRQQP